MINILGDKANTRRRSELSDKVGERTDVTERWKGVPHRELAEGIVEAVESHGIAVTSEKWYVDRSGWTMVGGLGLSIPRKAKLAKLSGMEYAMGIMHSNDGRKAIRIAAGARVMVCENGVLTGSFLVKKRHTKHLELMDNLNEGVERLVAELAHTKAFVEALKGSKMDAGRVDRVSMEIGRRGLLPWSAVGKVDREYREPSFPVFKKDHGNAWGYYNAYNYVLQQVTPDRQIRSLDGVREVLLPGSTKSKE
jgi:hypothetical protein